MSVNSKMTAIADKIRSLLGINGKLGLDAMSTNLETANTEVTTQEELMEQIIDALEGKSVGGGSAKEEQEKTVDITENGTTEVIPDSGKVLSKVIVNVEVESGGGSGEDNPLKYATFANGALFRGSVFPENYVVDIVITADESQGVNINQIFMNSKNVDEINLFIIGETGSLYMNNAFYNSTPRRINMNGITIKPINVANCYSYNQKLEEVNAIHDLSKCTNNNNIFVNVSSLKEVRFVENTIKLSISFVNSSLLSDDSIQSIIDGLATVGTAQTLTFHADVKAKLTDAQKSTITGKNWTLA